MLHLATLLLYRNSGFSQIKFLFYPLLPRKGEWKCRNSLLLKWNFDRAIYLLWTHIRHLSFDKILNSCKKSTKKLPPADCLRSPPPPKLCLPPELRLSFWWLPILSRNRDLPSSSSFWCASRAACTSSDEENSMKAILESRRKFNFKYTAQLRRCTNGNTYEKTEHYQFETLTIVISVPSWKLNHHQCPKTCAVLFYERLTHVWQLLTLCVCFHPSTVVA